DSLDLRDANLSYFIDGGVGAAPAGLGCTILTCLNSATLQILNKNEGTVDNDVYVRAATGENAATTTKEGNIDIETGNAYASAAVLNMVNTNFINSKYLVATFDNFGDMQGDIVLPSASFFSTFFKNGNTLPDLNSSSYIVSNDNDETFTGTTTAHALTGGNVATTTTPGDGHGEVRTGKAYTSSTSFTAANQTHVGGSSVLFVFHVSGAWSGQVKGLPEGMSWRQTEYGIEVYSNGAVGSTRGQQGIYNSANFIASSTNKAIVNTDVNVWAETGENRTLTENGVGSIKTGDAYAIANVVNMVNTNVVNRNFMFAVFNITGDWSGDIDFGGHSPNLAVQASATGANPAAPGSLITYRFTVRNNGDVAADNVVLTTAYERRMVSYTEWSSGYSKTDTVTGTSFALGSIPVGGFRTIEVTARLDVRLSANSSTQIPLVASVTSSQHDQDDNDNTTTIGVLVSSGAPPPPPPPPPPPSGGGGGGGSSTPPPSGGGGGGTGTGTGSGTGTDSTGTGTGTGTNNGSTNTNGANNASSTGAAAGAAAGSSSGGGGGGGGGPAAGWMPVSSNDWTAAPTIRVTKTASVSTTTAPTIVDYKVVVVNDKNAGPAYKGLLTDTLYDPKGAIMYNRSWDLETIVPGDQITLTYSVEYGTSTVPGIYKNLARVTGKSGNPTSAIAPPMAPVEARQNVVLVSSGLVLGTSTSTPKFATSNISSAPASCTPLLASYMKQGPLNNKTDVMKLQTFLNSQGAKLPTTGFYGSLTTAAVKAFQLKYKNEILTPLGLTRPTGNVYGSTQRTINRLNCGLSAPAAGAPSAVGRPTIGIKSATPASAAAPAPALAAAPTASPSPVPSVKPPVKKPKPAAPKKPVAPQSTKVLSAVGSWFSKFTGQTPVSGP
ncbi:MAG: hypothetical protein Q7S50_02110, partial [bacterium]|nr:hypothetical protein [bacterium]